jgi:beta-glucosidase
MSTVLPKAVVGTRNF